MTRIPKEEIRFDPVSYIDPSGRVFEWKGDIYRAIGPDMAGHFEWLAGQGFFKSLQSQGLIVNTEKTDHLLDGAALVLKHEKITPATYCFEWPPEMLKDAAILTIRLCLELNKHGLTLQDAYPWNVYFKGARPVFIDVGSIVKTGQDMIWEAYQEFCNFFLYPLYLYSAGLYDAARPMLTDYLNGISDRQCFSLLPLRKKFFSRGPLFRLTLTAGLSGAVQKMKLDDKLHAMTKDVSAKADLTKARRHFFEGLLKELESVRFPAGKTPWSSYYAEMKPYTPSADWNAKEKAVFEALNNLKPGSILDIACNKGWYSILAAGHGCRTISFDTDAECISYVYGVAKKENLDITPLVMNLLNPSPTTGWALRQFPSAVERLGADMCLALAFIHHAVFSQWQDFDRVIESIGLFTKKWMLIEYIPKDDEKALLLLSRKKDIFPWYTFDNFKRSIEKRYTILKISDSCPSSRKLVLCEKR